MYGGDDDSLQAKTGRVCSAGIGAIIGPGNMKNACLLACVPGRRRRRNSRNRKRWAQVRLHSRTTGGTGAVNFTGAVLLVDAFPNGRTASICTAKVQYRAQVLVVVIIL